MSLKQLTTIAAVQQFFDGTQNVAFSVATNKKERYRWVQRAMVKHCYLFLNKADKGIITRYLMKVTGYSRAQIKRLIQQLLIVVFPFHHVDVIKDTFLQRLSEAVGDRRKSPVSHRISFLLSAWRSLRLPRLLQQL